ncbi:ABC-type transport system involved in multi-copper enzyme maturation permease subunit [Desulfosalsimonas propionicica]|uniref:ABC-type transport system involved in multi-copper enzyme maturation permease subunit n=1 Tax=Desulfosalsimonas propionicica TaxID=332175 RepID=A0A7W0C7K7_9BACT|nr:ABC transporter permease [Desulfosalsimonas propionicica]MBA2880636.1 ABC-type transport system involved in multi-copper enzyme maturation permease subunit [Desulfosalsimonas propionicica]
MNIIWQLSRITFKQGIYSKVLYGIVLLSLILFVSNLFITQLFSLEIGKVAIDVGFAVFSLAGLSIVFFMGIGMISRDIHQKNIRMVICHPVSRWQYVAGKFAGLCLFLLVAVAVLGVFSAFSLWLGTVSAGGIQALRNFSWLMLFATILSHLLALLIILAVGFLFTVITSSGYLAMLLTFVVYIIGNTLDTVVKVLVQGEHVQADLFFTNGLKLLSWIFPNLSAFDLKVYLSYGLSCELSSLLWLGAYGISYILLLLFLTAAMLHKKDLC